MLSRLYKFIFLAVLLYTTGAISTLAQSFTAGREAYTTWDDFVSAYLEDGTDGENNSESGLEAALQRLEELHASPININTAARNDLLLLPFLSESQADSIIAYRQRKRLFLSLGELQFIYNLPHTHRKWLSLFTYAGDTLRPVPTLKTQLTAGQHEVSARTDLPLYKRAGYQKHPKEELLQYPNRIYLGNNLANTVRYRYKYRKQAAYGITLQKDAGEPFGQYGNRPYDYTSAYFHLAPAGKRYALWAGDYEVRTGQGLLAGNSFMTSKVMMTGRLHGHKPVIRQHSSTDETDFMRGAAVSLQLNSCEITAFASWRQLDARTENDTAVTLYTTGLHRTISEITHKGTLDNLTGGLNAIWKGPDRHIGATLLYDHYSHTVFPALRDYNRYYLRGKTAAGAAIDYALRHKRWSNRGEAAIDRNGHPAVTHAIRYESSSGTAWTLQGRYFSPRYVAPHSTTLQENSRVQNEAGALLGVTSRITDRLEGTAYVDAFLFPRPTYRASRNRSKGIETYLQLRYTTDSDWTFLFRYKLKSKQQSITGHAGMLEYATTHRMRLATTCSPSPLLSLYAAADATIATRQTSAASKGGMLSLRCRYRPSPSLSLGGFAATFFTDDYASRIFGYEPQLRYAGAFPAYYYHGMRLVSLVSWNPLARLQLSARYSLTRYFNRSHISSGTQLIDAPSQNDITLQLHYNF